MSYPYKSPIKQPEQASAKPAVSDPVLTIFFQLDPFNPTIGGIQTCIKYVLKYAPSAFTIQLVGVTHDETAVGRWQQISLHGRRFSFLPLLKVADDNVRKVVPTTVRYALALRKYLRHQTIASDFYQFHRIEPAVFTGKLQGTKLLYIHNDIYQEIKGNQKGGILWKRFPRAYFALERRLVPQFDRILSCNSESVKLYQQQYPAIASRVSYLRNTFDGELFYPLTPPEKDLARVQLAQKLGLPPKTRFILFAGRLHPQKRPKLLIQAMAQLQSMLQTQLKTHLIIVGKGELEGAVRAEIASLGLRVSSLKPLPPAESQAPSHVTFLGSLPQLELANLYRACDLFTLTSAYEGLARGSLESLACGTPVVTTKAGETPKFLASDSGIVCANAQPKTIANCWQQVLLNASDFSAEACTRVAKPYEASLVVGTLYSTLLTQWQTDHANQAQAAFAFADTLSTL